MAASEARESIPDELRKHVDERFRQEMVEAEERLANARAEGRTDDDTYVCKTCMYCDILLDIAPDLTGPRIALASQLVYEAHNDSKEIAEGYLRRACEEAQKVLSMEPDNDGALTVWGSALDALAERRKGE